MPDSITKTVAKNTFWLLLGNIGNRLLSFLLIIILARRLGDINFGKFSFVQSFVQIFVVLMDLGMGFLIIREIARNREKAARFVSNALTLRLILSFFVFVLIALSIGLLQYPQDTKILVYLFSFYFIFVSLGSLFSSVFMAYEKMEFNVAVGLCERVFIILFCLWALSLNAGLFVIGRIYCLGGFCSFLLAFGLLRYRFFIKPKLGIDWRFSLSLLKEALPIAIGSILVMLYFYSNTVILSKIKGDQAVGWYSSGFYLAFYTQLIPGAFLGAIFPLWSRLFQDSNQMLKQLYQKSFELMLAFAVPVGLGGYILADKIIPYFYGQAYLNSIVVFQILISGTIFFCLNSLFGHFLVSINRQVIATKISALAVATNLIIAFTLVGRLSYIGVSIALVVSSIVTFFAAICYLYKIEYHLIFHKPLLKTILASLAMGATLYFFKKINLFLLIFMGSIIYIATLLLSKYFSGEDMFWFKGFKERC